MPRLRPDQLPRLRRRKDGQAVTTLSGEDHYLGPWGNDPNTPCPAAVAAYREAVARWEARGRKPRPKAGPGPTIAVLADRFAAHVLGAYTKRGRPTSYAQHAAQVARQVAAMFGSTKVEEFGPDDLKAVRQGWVAAGHNLKTINDYTRLALAMFQWGYDEAVPRLVPPPVVGGLRAIRPLKRGAPPAGKVGPVPEADFAAVVELAPQPLRDMLLVQRWTGMRPREICAVEARDIDRSGTVWRYSVPPRWNKMDHRGQTRTVSIGPKAQAILAPRIERHPRGPLFPNRNGRAAHPKDYWDRVKRLCKKANVDHFAPNRLRHSFATQIRAEKGLEVAQAALGHSRPETTTIYAERREGLADEAAELG